MYTCTLYMYMYSVHVHEGFHILQYLYDSSELGDLGLRLRPGMECGLHHLISLLLTPQQSSLQLQYLERQQNVHRYSTCIYMYIHTRTRTRICTRQLVEHLRTWYIHVTGSNPEAAHFLCENTIHVHIHVHVCIKLHVCLLSH